MADFNGPRGPSRDSDAFATRSEVKDLAVKLDDNTVQLKSVQITIETMGLTVRHLGEVVTQMLEWLQGKTNADGSHKAGLIDQNTHLFKLVRSGVRWGIALLTAILVAILTNAATNIITHADKLPKGP